MPFNSDQQLYEASKLNKNKTRKSSLFFAINYF
jgi:hypothetical protein